MDRPKRSDDGFDGGRGVDPRTAAELIEWYRAQTVGGSHKGPSFGHSKDGGSGSHTAGLSPTGIGRVVSESSRYTRPTKREKEGLAKVHQISHS